VNAGDDSELRTANFRTAWIEVPNQKLNEPMELGSGIGGGPGSCAWLLPSTSNPLPDLTFAVVAAVCSKRSALIGDPFGRGDALNPITKQP
jgi:hypothetical protein